MADDQRVYSDEEFALILRKATELASRADRLGSSSAGLTLAEMKAAAAEVGLDPAFVERAARMLANTTASPLERLIGGQLRHDHEARFPIKLDEDRAARHRRRGKCESALAESWTPSARPLLSRRIGPAASVRSGLRRRSPMRALPGTRS